MHLYLYEKNKERSLPSLRKTWRQQHQVTCNAITEAAGWTLIWNISHETYARMQISDNLGKSNSQRPQGFPVNVRMKLKIGKWVSWVGQQVCVHSAIPVDTERKGFKHIYRFCPPVYPHQSFYVLYIHMTGSLLLTRDLWPIVLVSGITAIMWYCFWCNLAWLQCDIGAPKHNKPCSSWCDGRGRRWRFVCIQIQIKHFPNSWGYLGHFSVSQIYFRFWWMFFTVT